jgi:hypothetical protein
VRDLPPHIGPEQVLSGVLLAGGRRCCCKGTLPSVLACLCTWQPIIPWAANPSTPTPAPACPALCCLQANDEYRRYMADWWGDAIKAEFEERKADPQ